MTIDWTKLEKSRGPRWFHHLRCFFLGHFDVECPDGSGDRFCEICAKSVDPSKKVDRWKIYTALVVIILIIANIIWGV